MKPSLSLLLCAALAGCAQVQSGEQQSKSGEQVTIGSFTLAADTSGAQALAGEPLLQPDHHLSIGSFTLVTDTSGEYRFKLLQIFPIAASNEFIQAGSHLGPYITLKEAMERKVIIITEMYDSVRTVNAHRQNESSVITDASQVNTLFIENVSEDTILILAGELIKGGKQDRLIARDFLLNPKSGKSDVSVFCVEPHRWHGEESAVRGVSNLEEVQVYHFNEYQKVASNKIRKTAVKEKDQGKVWRDVAYVTDQNGASSASGSYNAIGNAATYKSEHDAYEKFFASKFNSSTNIVGVIIASGDSIIGCDIFYDPGLFRKEYVNLLDAYITDAITLAAKSNAGPGTIPNYFSTIAGDYNNSAEKSNSSKFMHAGSVIHYTSF